MDAAKQIFLDAIDLPAPQRAAFIDGRCNGDAALRGRVAALLSAHDQADHVIVEPTVMPWGATAGGGGGSLLDAAVLDHPERPGSVVGDYVIERVLGEGGFGMVYLARQEFPVRRFVALKIMHRGMSSRDFVRRFQLERQALAVMDHPGVAKVFDAGETPTRSPYFAMEYVDGLPITEFCDAERLGLRDRLKLFEDVCHAVQHAHTKGLIHRDLKPSNVLVTKIDGKAFPKIIDFGIAKAADRHDFAADLTRPQQIIGTPQYMAPEQASLTDVDIDTRADVYSLGAILYELLTGTPVFASSRLRNLRPSELEKIICEEEPPRPSTRVGTLDAGALEKIGAARDAEPARLPRQLAGDLDWICLRALEKDRARRYPAALSLAADIRRYLRDEPVEACPPTLNYRFVKFARRHRVEFAAGATVALALAAFALGSAWFAVREHRTARQLQRELQRANALTLFSQDLLSGVDPAEARGLDTTLMRKILAGSVAKVDAQLADQPEAAAVMLLSIGHAHMQIGNFDEAERTLRTALMKAVPAVGDENPTVMEVTETLATVLADTGRYPESEALLVDLLAKRRHAQGPEHRDTLVTVGNIAALYEKSGRWTEARKALEELVAIRERVLGPDHPDVLTSLNNLASCIDNLGDEQAAVPILLRVLDAQTRTIGEDHPRTLSTMNNLAAVYRGMGRTDEARALYEKAVAIKTRVNGPTHVSTLVTRTNLAAIYRDEGKLEEAEREYRAALDVPNPQPGPNDTRVAALNGLGMIAKIRGNFPEAADYAQRAVELARQSMGPKHPSIIVLCANLGSVRMEAKQYAAAEQAARDALALAADTVGTRHPSALNPRRVLARSLAAQERWAEAAEALSAALEEIEKWPEGLREPAYAEVARYYDAAGDAAKAQFWRARAPTTRPSTQPSAPPTASPPAATPAAPAATAPALSRGSG